MALAAGAAIAAGTSAAAAYLDAKYHIRKDLTSIRSNKRVAKEAQRLAQANKRSLWYAFEETVAQHKDNIGLWYRPNPSVPAAQYTWRQTYDQSCRWAQFLLNNGVQPGELVGTYVINSPEFMFNMLGSWAIGTAPALINYNLGGDSLVHCLKVAGSKVLIVDSDSECQQRIEAQRERIENELGMRIIILDEATKATINAYEPTRPGNEFRDHVEGEFPIFLFYTSGTTGFPKACAFQTQRAGVLGQPRLQTTGLKPGDRWYDCMPLYHGTGCTTAVGCMMTGVTLCVGRKFSVRNFWRDIHDSESNAFVYVGETARYLLAAPPSSLDKDHKLKAMYGNGMRPDIWRKFQQRFNVPCVNEFFNSTEGMFSLLNICNGPFHEAHVGHQGAIQRWQFHNIYVPVEIDHENGDKIWRDPKTGLARRKTKGLRRLLEQSGGDGEALTEKRFERDVFQKGDLYYRTGDALRRDDDGRWFFLDRLGDTFRWKSENVSTAEVAEVLGRFPGLLEANVYGVEVPNHDGKAGCAAVFIRPEEREKFNWSGLLQHARKGLPKYAVPVFIRVIKSPTTMHNNKQNKVPLRKEGIDFDKIANGEAGSDDELLWVQGDTYVPFQPHDLESIGAGKARL
ncbi:hypothetical protein Q7P37_001727 [Cladosporium fusiforme]